MQSEIKPSETRRAPIEEVQAFVEVVAAGSFSAASSRLNLSHSSLSRKVAYLEQWIGAQLLQRTTQGVQLTEIGLQHFQQFRQGLELIRSGLLTQGRAEKGDAVRLATPPSMAIFWLFPRQEAIAARAGGVPVQYLLERRQADFSDNIDLAIRYGQGPWNNTRSVLLMPDDLRPVAGPALALALGENPEPEALLGMPLVHVVTDMGWKIWFEAQGIPFRLRPFDYVFDEQTVVIPAVENGLGLGLSRPAWRHLVDGERLIHVSPRVVPLDIGYSLVRMEGRPLRHPAEAYAHALLSDIGASEAAIAAFLE